MPAPTDSRSLRPGDGLEVSIEKGVYRGLGLARHQGQVVLVPRALPGDRWRVRVESVERGFLRARAEELLAPGANRRPSPCALADRCGGCAYQELDYAAQLGLKEAVLRESLARARVAWDGEIPLAGSAETGWRTRASLHLERRGADLLLGLHEEGTHRVVDLPRCLQLSDAMTRASRALLDALRRQPQRARAIRHVDLAESVDGRELVMALETELDVPGAVALSGLAGVVPGLTGFGAMAGEGKRRRYLSLHGDPHVRSTVAGAPLRAHVRSFFQSNRFLLEPLTAAVLELSPPGGTVLDLYAGVGLFALPLARRSERVRAAELNPMAVEDARWNAEQAGLRDVEIHRGDVREALELWPVQAGERVVLDPPRTGAGADVVRRLAGRRPAAIVYVSCDPATLARDLKLFEGEGYRPDTVRAFDLFPDTFHLETVVRLVTVP
jgi:23S rRNA (uracil1939-C5)-methyltransferase